MRKRNIARLLIGVLAINLTLPIISVAAPGDNGDDSSYVDEFPGDEDEDYDFEDDYEDDVSSSPRSSPTTLETDSKVSGDDIKKGTNIDLDVRDLVVSDSVVTSSSGRVRVAEVYSLNNNLADCYYRPLMEEIPNLNAYVLKYGQYAAAYMGFYDVGHKESPKPAGMQSRALEIIGYDCLLSSEEYDVRTKKYRRTLITDGSITEESAIMNIYKALGIELRDIKMYHEKASFTKENSPAAALLARDPIKYSLTMVDGYGTLQYIDVMDSFNTYVFVSRTNPELYMRKLNQDFNIPMSQSKQSQVTLADFIIMCKKMMEYYGEPVMNQTEMNQLLQVYGADIPTGLTDELRDAWLYLKARGVLNVDDSGLFANLTIADMNDILMCIKDRDSRTNFKEIQVVMNIGDTLINAGYYPDQMTFTQADRAPMEYDVDYSTAESFDYFIPISDEYSFMGGGVSRVNTMYVSEDPNGMGTELSGSYYVGVVDNKYWHFIIPAEVSRSSIKDNIYIRIESTGAIDTPECLYVELGGGYYKKSQKIGNSYYFIRHNFDTNTYEDYVDTERKNGTEFDNSKWGEEKNETPNIRLPNYEENKKPTLPNVEDSDWDGIDYTYYKDSSWELEESSGKWRLYYKDDDRDKTMASSEIVRVGASNNSAEEIYYIDYDGYCVAGWYDWGSQWVFFNDGQVDGFKYGQMVFAVNNVVIDGEEYSFDMYGWLIGSEYGNPEEGDEWEYYNNLEGEWKKEGDKWWFMQSDGTWPTGSIEKINDKLYMFDDEGYMLTGWQEYEDEYQYYFYPEDGYMARNTVTPDGYRVDLNGRPISKEVVAFFNISAVRNFLAYVKNGFAITSYAAPSAPTTTSLGYKQSDRWYVLKVPMELIDTNSFSTFQTWYDQQRTSKPDSNKPLRQGKNEAGEKILVIQTKMRPDYVFSHITYKENSTSYNLLSNVKTITSLNGNYLVNFYDLVQLGIFNEEITQNAADKEITLYGILQNDGVNTSNERTAQNQKGWMSQRSGFGEVILRNKASDKRVKVGTTVYSLPDTTEVFAFNIEDTNSSVNWEDGQEASDETASTGLIRDTLLYGHNNDQLYVDFRVAYGWATSELNFYNCQTVTSDIGSAAKNIIVTYGKDIKTRGAKIRQIKQSGLSGDSRRTPFMTSLIDWNNGEAYLLPMVNNYSCASFALADTPSNNGGHTLMCVQFVPACEQTKAMNKGDDKIANFGKLKVPSCGDAYYRKITDITNLNGGLKDITNTQPEQGKWYTYPGFGIVYCLPKYSSGVEAENNFYSKWLDDSDDYLIPLCYINGDVVDMSMPYFPTVEYGKQPQRIAQNNAASCVPNVAGISYLMWEEQLDSRTISELQTSGSNSSRRYYFGSMLATIDTNNGVKTLTIPGLTSNNGDTQLMPNITNGLRFIRIDTMYDWNYNGGSTGESGGFEIYTTVPETIKYDVVSEEAAAKTKVTLGSANGLSDLFKDYEAFTFQDLVNKIDESESFLVLFSIIVLPYIGFILSLAVLGMALCADSKPVQWFCNNVIDPIKILTFGQKDVNTVGGMRFFWCVMCVVVGFALAANGNILRIIMWCSAFFSEVFRLWQML